MDLGAIFSTAFLVGLSGAMMPGPLLTVTVAETARRGFVAGPLIVLGHAILEVTLIILLATGLAAFLTRPAVGSVIALVGGLFLLYMGFGMVRDALTGRVSLVLSGNDDTDGAAGTAAAEQRLHPVWAGILISLSNPYWSLWWATVGLGYITFSLKAGSLGIATFFSGHITADAVWYFLIAGAVAGGRRFLNDRIYRGILVACGLFLLGLGGYFLYQGIW
jgi:threonine/homoserine/homoserine lactone efflux protein